MIKGLPRTFWVVFAGELVNRAGNMVVAFLTYYLASRGLGAAEVGRVMVAFGLGCLVSQPVGGLLADRVGRRFTLILGLLLSAGALAFMGMAQGYPALVAAAATLGAVGEIYRPAAAAVVADVVPVERRGQAYGLLFWAINLGYPVAGAGAGLLAVHGYWLLFTADSVSCLLFAVVIATAMPRTASRATSPKVPGVGYRGAARDRLLRMLLGLTFVNASVYALSFVAVPIAVRDAGLGPEVYSLVPVANGLLIITLQPWISRHLVRRARLRVLAAAWLLGGAGMALTGLARTPIEFVATVVVWTSGEIAAGGLSAALAADLAPPASRGRYQALFGWAAGSSRLAAAGLVTVTYGAHAPAVLWCACAAIGALSALAGLRLAPQVEQRRLKLTAATGPHSMQEATT